VTFYLTDHGIQFHGVQTARAQDRRQDRLFRSPDAGAVQVSEGAYPHHAEDDHPGDKQLVLGLVT